MVKINKIYTRTGDRGTTGLVSGERVSKNEPRVVAYGTVDETNAAIGLALAALAQGQHACAEDDARTLAAQLTTIQHDLFDLGADLATPGDIQGALRVVPAQVERLEREIDGWNELIKPLTSFVLPGGSPASAALHLARTVCRRAERLTVAVYEAEHALDACPPALTYLNRLSDLLFIACRVANDRGRADVLWQPGKSREESANSAGASGATGS